MIPKRFFMILVIGGLVLSSGAVMSQDGGWGQFEEFPYDWCYALNDRDFLSFDIALGHADYSTNLSDPNVYIFPRSYDETLGGTPDPISEDDRWGIFASAVFNRTVSPIAVEFDFTRFISSSTYQGFDTLPVVGYLQAFGISSSITSRMILSYVEPRGTLPADRVATLRIAPSSAGVSGNNISLSLLFPYFTSGVLREIRVFGLGASPFPASDEPCAPVDNTFYFAPYTATPVTQSAPTATPTSTAIPFTNTPTPTATQGCTPVTETISFLSSNGGAASHAFGTYWQSGAGWRYNGSTLYQGTWRHRAAINLNYPITGILTEISVDWVRLENGTRSENGEASLQVFSDAGTLLDTGQNNTSAFVRSSLSLTDPESFRFSVFLVNDGPTIRSITITYNPPSCFPTATPTGTAPVTAIPSATLTPISPTATPSRIPPVTNTPLVGVTLLPSSTPYIPATFPPLDYIESITPPPPPPPTNTRLPIIIPPTYTPLVTATTGTPIVATPTITPTSEYYEPGDVETGIGAMFGAIISEITNILNQSRDYMDQMGGAASEIMSSWANTAPRALPGLPMCETNPLDYEVCAIYYILRNTIFSGAIGSIILSFAQMIMYIWVTLAFISLARAIIARLANVTKA